MLYLDEWDKQLEQKNKVKGKDPQYRTEYRFSRGTKHYMYFMTQEEAEKFNYIAVNYPPIGLRPHKTRPLSKQIQIKGPRGGWRKVRNAVANCDK